MLLNAPLRDANPFNAPHGHDTKKNRICQALCASSKALSACRSARAFSVMHNVPRRADPLNGAPTLFPRQIRIRRFGNKRRDFLHASVMNELTDMRRADGFTLRLRTRNNHQLDSGLGKNLRKRIVIQAGRMGKRFFTDIPPRQIQCRGDARKQSCIQCRMRSGHQVAVLQEIRRECCGRNHIAARGYNGYILIFFCRGANHRQTILKGNE